MNIRYCHLKQDLPIEDSEDVHKCVACGEYVKTSTSLSKLENFDSDMLCHHEIEICRNFRSEMTHLLRTMKNHPGMTIESMCSQVNANVFVALQTAIPGEYEKLIGFDNDKWKRESEVIDVKIESSESKKKKRKAVNRKNTRRV